MRKRRINNDIIIDLTSLLDVVFIVLLLTICNQKNVDAKQAIEQENLKAQEQKLQESIDANNALAKMAKGTCRVYIDVPFDEADAKNRTITVYFDNSEEPETYKLVGRSEESFDVFESNLKSYVADNAEKPVMISINEDDSKILYRDDERIKKIVDEIQKNSNHNVYICSGLQEDE